MNINTRVKQYFDGNPRKDTLFFTEDYCGFYSEDDARGHGDALKKKGISEKVTPVTRDELNKWIAEQPKAELSAEGNTGNPGGKVVKDLATLVQECEAAQAAYDAAVVANVDADIISTRKALTVAKGLVTRATNKQ